jgi:GNAT superfamily N-acetyltransferase
MPAIEAPVSAVLGADSIPGVLALAAEAGWNQAAADIALFVDHGRLIGVTDDNGRLIASAAALPMGPAIGWVSMVLVTAASRRRGIATRLVEECVAWLAANGRAAVLDATELGREVYARMGFEKIATLTRWGRAATASAVPHAAAPDAAAQLPAIAAYDAAVFGAPRAFVLADMLGRPGGVVRLAGGGANGFLLTRAGRLATEIGPVSADDTPTGVALLEDALAALPGRLMIDVFDAQPDIGRLLAARGFAVERRFYRMVRGGTGQLGDPARAFASAGPEIG